ncbi:MAG: hypothetical protein N2Z21_07500 [Candidatus Sumerlaeaceae bacterium]|nr:hypothetical protein [Candidatus Sumerlaeaceae bacterium]
MFVGRTVASVCLFLLLCFQAQALQIHSEIEPREPLVGKPCRLVLVVEGNRASEVKVSDSFLRDAATTWTQLTRNPSTQTSRSPHSIRISYELIPLRAGVQPLPPVPLQMPDGKLELLTLKPVIVRSHISPDEITTSPFGVKLAGLEERIIPPAWARVIPRVLALITLFLVLGAAIAIWMLARRRSSASSVPLPPDLRALSELDKLASEGLIAKRQFKEFYSRLSNTIRSFIGTVWGFDGLECTTAELLTELQNRPVPLSLQREISETLEEADLVKFAKYQPEPSSCEKAIARARSIVMGISALRSAEQQRTEPGGGHR